ncbi:MAG: ABC transporter permease [Actinomycetota bacterium]|jgi:branched-subunit amino acid ABC-type transport system permease component|nr:ABC transporter permease [Actinomycetota bacterium]MDA8279906.1 ABC transporter permease [Actinomycetota bacterium]
MNSLLNYAIPGVPYGCEFALMAVGLVLTYRATGVFNLAFGAQAFLSAFVYDLVQRSDGMPQWVALVVSVGLLAPALGLVLDRLLYRRIPQASTTAKVVVSIGVLIAIPELVPMVFSATTRTRLGHLWLPSGRVYVHLAQTPVTGAVISTVVISVGVVAVLAAMLRWSGFGLRMRAVVESRRMAQLEGIASTRVAATAWVLSSVLAGLAGVLLLPQMGSLDPTQPLEFTALLVAGMTAAAAAGLTSLPGAFVAGVAIGVLETVVQQELPSGSVVAQGLIPALPFVLLVGALLVNPRLRTLGRDTDPLASVDPPPPQPAVTTRDARLALPMRWGFRLLVVAFLVSSLTWVSDTWVFPFGQGLAFSVIFLSITLVTGMGGQLSLCQATFAGIGAFTTGQLAAHFGLPVLLGALAGAALAAAVGAGVALVVARVSGLLLTLVTLAFALFADSVLFQFSWSGGGLAGVTVPRPQLGPVSFAGDRAFLLLAFVVLVACAGIVVAVQRGATGRMLAALRGSPAGAAAVGIDPARARVTIFALSGAMAGVGGALYGSIQGPVSPADFQYVVSLAFVLVVVTTGSRTVEGAVQAGMAYAVIAQALTYVPTRFSGIELILFAAGALTYAAHPEGIVEYQRSVWLERANGLLRAHDRYRQERGGKVGRSRHGDGGYGGRHGAVPGAPAAAEVVGRG